MLIVHINPISEGLYMKFWAYKKSLVVNALRRWKEDHVLSDEVYVWWDFFCINQFRLLEEKRLLLFLKCV